MDAASIIDRSQRGKLSWSFLMNGSYAGAQLFVTRSKTSGDKFIKRCRNGNNVITFAQEEITTVHLTKWEVFNRKNNIWCRSWHVCIWKDSGSYPRRRLGILKMLRGYIHNLYENFRVPLKIARHLSSNYLLRIILSFKAV